MSDYRDITPQDVGAFPALDDALSRAAERAVKAEHAQQLQRIADGDYRQLVQTGTTRGRVDCREFHLARNQIFPSLEALRQHAARLYPDGRVPDMEGEVRAMRNSHLLDVGQFDALFTSQEVLSALREGYVSGYLATARDLRDSPTTRGFILYHLAYQPFAHMTPEQKEARTEASMLALVQLLQSAEP
jgi:hypothetical protein